MRTATMIKTATALAITLATSMAFASTAFVPPTERIPEPYTNDKCLEKCHGEPGLMGSDEFGNKVSLSVMADGYAESTHGIKGVWCIDCHEGASPNEHPRGGYEQVDCRVCHAAEAPEGAFPIDGLVNIVNRGLKPPPSETHKQGDGWAKTRHAKEWALGNPKAPFCNDCHTAHYIKKADDPTSAVNSANLPATCGRCHEDEVRSYDEGGVLTKFRVSGHGKGDLGTRHAMTECKSCHQGEAAHGEESLTGQSCPNCHQPTKREEGDFFHIRPLSDEQPFPSVMRILYNLAIWGGGGLFLFIGLFAALTGCKKSGEEE